MPTANGSEGMPASSNTAEINMPVMTSPQGSRWFSTPSMMMAISSVFGAPNFCAAGVLSSRILSRPLIAGST